MKTLKKNLEGKIGKTLCGLEFDDKFLDKIAQT